MSKAPADVTGGRAYLRPGRDRPVRGSAPWIFSQAIGRVEPANLAAGERVEVFDAGGDLVGVGYYQPKTTIAIRMLAWGSAPSTAEIISRRVGSAIELRHRFVRDDTDSYRLINGDGDALSGVVVDRYCDVLVMQLLTAGADRMRDELVAELIARALRRVRFWKGAAARPQAGRPGDREERLR